MTYAQYILMWSILMSLYWVWYMWSRGLIDRRPKLGAVNFMINLVFFLYLVALVNVLIPIKFGVWNKLSLIAVTVMFLASVIHHVSIILEKHGVTRFKMKKMHRQISHLMFFVPYGSMSVVNGVGLYRKTLSGVDVVVLGAFVVGSMIITAMGILAGFSKVKFLMRD